MNDLERLVLTIRDKKQNPEIMIQMMKGRLEELNNQSIWDAVSNDLDTANLLLQNGFKPMQHWNDKLPTIKWKIEIGKVDPNDYKIENYSRIEDIEILKYLINKGADPFIKMGTSSWDLLSWITSYKNKEAVEFLLDLEIDFIKFNSLKQSVISLIFDEEFELVEKILGKANLNLPTLNIRPTYANKLRIFIYYLKQGMNPFMDLKTLLDNCRLYAIKKWRGYEEYSQTQIDEYILLTYKFLVNNYDNKFEYELQFIGDYLKKD